MSGESRRKAPGEWQEVQARKGRQESQQDEASKKVITKFFVSNLPPKCSSSDLKEVFRGFGVYEGSYIARKLDRMGKRFAFVSFRDIGDAKRLEGEMGDLWLGSYKLFVVLARFVDGHTVDNDKSVNKRKDKTVENVSTAKTYSGRVFNGVDKQVCRGHDNTEVGGGRSFLDTVLNKNKVDVIKVDDNIEGFSTWYGLSLVGKVIDFKILTTLKAVLGKRGWSYVAIKYVSGLNVMLVFKGLDDCDRFLMDKEMWSTFFVELEKWDGKGKAVDERIAWLQVHGIPVQLEIDQVLDVVGSRYGVVVQPARKSVDDNNFSYARIGVLCKSRGRIVDRVDIRWREGTYKVWIDEDVGEWIPDCLKDFDEGKDDFVPGDDLETGEIRGDVRLDTDPNTVIGTPLDVNAESPVNGFAVLKEGTSKGRKKFRRKNMFKNRGEASGSQERPKKRSRDDNDPFGLDRLIGIMATSTPQGTNEERESHGTFCTPDLNMGSDLQVQNEQVVEQTVVEDLVHEAGLRIDRGPLESEAEETVALARALGVENLQDFLPELHEILRSEGYSEAGH